MSSENSITPASEAPTDSVSMIVEDAAEAPKLKKESRQRLPPPAYKLLNEYWRRNQVLPLAVERDDMLQKIAAMGVDWYTDDRLKHFFYQKKTNAKRKAASQLRNEHSASAGPSTQDGHGGATYGGMDQHQQIQYTPDIIARLELFLATEPRPTLEQIQYLGKSLDISPEAIRIYIQIKQSVPVKTEPQEPPQLTVPLPAAQGYDAFGGSPVIESETTHHVQLPTPSHSTTPEPVPETELSTLQPSFNYRVNPRDFLMAVEKTLHPQEYHQVVEAFVDAGVVEKPELPQTQLEDHHVGSGVDGMEADNHCLAYHSREVDHTRSSSTSPSADRKDPRPAPHPLYQVFQEAYSTSKSAAPETEVSPRTQEEFNKAFAPYEDIMDDILRALEHPKSSLPWPQ